MELVVLTVLESGLVREFRLYQSLLHLTQDERQALRRGDVVRLMALAEHKENLLDRISALEPARSHFQAALASEATGTATPEQMDLLRNIEEGDRRRLVSLLEGIMALAAQVRDLVQGNRLLAGSALNQAASQQAGLLSDSRLDLPALFTALLAQHESGGRASRPTPENNLIEEMTYLHRQETAYRAVLKVSSRVLTTP